MGLRVQGFRGLWGLGFRGLGGLFPFFVLLGLGFKWQAVLMALVSRVLQRAGACLFDLMPKRSSKVLRFYKGV